MGSSSKGNYLPGSPYDDWIEGSWCDDGGRGSGLVEGLSEGLPGGRGLGQGRPHTLRRDGREVGGEAEGGHYPDEHGRRPAPVAPVLPALVIPRKEVVVLGP